jgi:hypothetical protein
MVDGAQDRVSRLIVVQTEAGSQPAGHRPGQFFTQIAAKSLSATDVIGKGPSQGRAGSDPDRQTVKDLSHTRFSHGNPD